MRIPVFAIASLWLGLAALPAHAGLDILRETRDGILYIDRDSIEKNGDVLRVMSTQDFHRLQKLDGHEYLSARAWYDVDCAGRKVRQTSLEIFPENMAMGGAVHSNKEVQEWQEPAEATRLGAIWKGLCAKR